MSTQCQTVAVFGANGQIGRQLLRAMNKSKEGQLKVLAFVSPTSDFQVSDFDEASIIEKRVDLKNITSDHLAKILASHDVNIVVSTLGNEVISKQGVIQDAAAIAGVRRFFPSEFGMHQIPWFENKGGYLHPIWDGKMRCFENATKHPAIQNGQMTYTVIGCGELYDLQEEQILCPWFERDESIKQNGYEIQCVGDPEAKMDYSSCADVAKYLVACIHHPEKSENRILGFRSDYISFQEVAELLRYHSGKQTRINLTSVDQARKILDNPSSAPKRFQRGSNFPVDFWILLRYVQGQGRFWRPPGLLHNDLFPEIIPTSVNEYFQRLYAK